MKYSFNVHLICNLISKVGYFSGNSLTGGPSVCESIISVCMLECVNYAGGKRGVSRVKERAMSRCVEKCDNQSIRYL
jgi:hypothetical protein